MNKYIINSFVECTLRFNSVESAKEFADQYGFGVCQVFLLDDNSTVFIGYGIENENGLMNGNEFTWI